MMAHELPLQAHGVPHLVPAAKPRKNKHHQSKIQLPNGQKPDFGPGKQRPPQLPNGEKPNFGAADQLKNENKKESSKGKKLKKLNVKRTADSNENKNVSSQGGRKTSTGATESLGSSGKNLESYAGSSFHSSPEALALPKPSFARSSNGASGSTGSNGNAGNALNPINPISPNQVSVVSTPPAQTDHLQAVPMAPMFHSPALQQVLPAPPMAAPGQYSHPAFVYQGVTGVGPPRYPITSYPPTHKPEFSYGPVMTPYHAPPGPMPPYCSYPTMPIGAAPMLQSHPGQRISFNDLISSSK